MIAPIGGATSSIDESESIIRRRATLPLDAMARHVRLSSVDRRAQFLDLGVRLFSERPYDDFSMDDVAAEAGVSKGLLYHYFPSKRHFYLAALRVAAGEILALTEPRAELPAPDQLRAGLDGYLRYVWEHAAAYRAVLRGGIGTDPEVAGVADEVRRTMMDRLLTGLGVERPGPRTRMAVRGWIGLVEAASLDWLEHDDIGREDLVGMLVEALSALLAIV